jgi:hypothetical protein
MKQKSFGVTSKFFSLYQAFKTEAEKLGVEWNSSFNAFEESKMTRTGIFIANNWHKAGSDSVKMSFSNFTENIFDLDSNFEGAIEKLKDFVSVKEMTLEEVERELGYKIIIKNS